MQGKKNQPKNLNLTPTAFSESSKSKPDCFYMQRTLQSRLNCSDEFILLRVQSQIFFLVGAFSFTEKIPTITVTSFFSSINRCMRSGHFSQNY